jgi:hypothetical protein
MIGDAMSAQPANFLLHEKTHDVEPPECPHIVCIDGFAWHPPPDRRQRDHRPCFQGFTHAPAQKVAAVLQGRPIDRLWALRCLLVGEHEDDPRWPGVIVVLWPDECRGCHGDHTHTAIIWRRAALAIQPSAIGALRDADPPLRLLLDPEVPPDRRYKKERRRPAGIPIRGTPEETARAQSSWALDLAAQREHPIHLARASRKAVQDGTGTGAR